MKYMKRDSVCKVDVCDKPVWAKNYCSSHHEWKRLNKKEPVHAIHSLTEHVDPQRSPTDAEIMWAAGFYEGEGNCSYKSNNKCPSIRIVQKDPWSLDKLLEIYGGKINIYRQSYSGRTYPMWQIHGARARKFIEDVFDYLSPRRQAQIKAE